MPDDQAVPVPQGERQDLQDEARRTGERFGRMDAETLEMRQHFAKLNGSVSDLARGVAAQATAMAVQAAAMKSQAETRQHREGISLQVWLAIFAAVVALFLGFAGFVVTIFVVLISNGKL